jgi:hypothetical protein
LTSTLGGGEWSASSPGRLTPWRKSLRYELDRRLGGSQNRSGRRGQGKNLLPLPGLELRPLGRPSRHKPFVLCSNLAGCVRHIRSGATYRNCQICEHTQFLFLSWGGVRLESLCTAATTGLLYQPQMIDYGDCGEIGGMKIGKGNRSTRRKPASAPLCPPQIPHDQTWARTWAAAVGSQRLTA